MGEILSAEDIANTRAAAMNVYHEAPDPFMRGMLRILDSHEALRRRLAEVEAERDTYRTAHISTESALHTARGRLAEVEQALHAIENEVKVAVWHLEQASPREAWRGHWGRAHEVLTAVLDKREQG